MNIAFLSSASLSNPKESARITLLSLAKSLQKHGHYICIITEKVPGRPGQETIEGIPVFRCYRSPGKILSYLLSVRKLRKENKIKFIYLVKGQKINLGEQDIDAKKIFENGEVRIFEIKW